MWARADMSGLCASHDLIRICPDESEVPAGYLYAFLACRHGHAWIRKQIYGGNIKHIEPSHLKVMPVPRFRPEVEEEADRLVKESSLLLTKFNSGLEEATRRFFSSVGLSDITSEEWHGAGRDLSFTCTFPRTATIRALNYNPRYLRLVAKLKSVTWSPLGDLVQPGTLMRGGRFKRVDAAPEHSYQLIGQKQLFWLHRRGRWVAKWALGDEVLVSPGTILVAARGTLGETELYCRGEFIWGAAADMAYSEDLLRIVADPGKMPPGCLYAFIRSETAFRLFRSISSGSKQQDHHRDLRPTLPVPLPPDAERKAIHNLVVQAYECKNRGIALELEARALVERAIEAAT